MPKTQTQELTEAVQLYLDLMYDCDVGKFDRVFCSTSQLHGFREGKMTCWPAAQYKEVLAGRKSPKALGSPREEQVLLLDLRLADPGARQGARAHQRHALRRLPLLPQDRRAWLITSKAYHREA